MASFFQVCRGCSRGGFARRAEGRRVGEQGFGLAAETNAVKEHPDLESMSAWVAPPHARHFS